MIRAIREFVADSCWRLAVFCLLGAALPSVANAQPSLDDVLAAWERSDKGVRSYDVRLRITKLPVLKFVATGWKMVDGHKQPLGEWHAWPADEDRPITAIGYRQVRDPDGRRRIEKYAPDGTTRRHLLVRDGEIEHFLDDQGRSGSIRPPNGFYIEMGEDYESYFRNDVAVLDPLLPLFKNRQSAKIASEQDRGFVLITAEPEEKTSFFAYRIWLDPQHGMMPAKVESDRCLPNERPRPFCRIVVNSFKEIEPAIWIPIDATVSFFSDSPSAVALGRPTTEWHAEVDVAKSRWNQPLDADLFRLTFPPGTRVRRSIP